MVTRRPRTESPKLPESTFLRRTTQEPATSPRSPKVALDQGLYPSGFAHRPGPFCDKPIKQEDHPPEPHLFHARGGRLQYTTSPPPFFLSGPPPGMYHPPYHPPHLPSSHPSAASHSLNHPYSPAPALWDFGFGHGPAPLFGWESVIPLQHGYGSPKYFKRVKPDYRRFCFSVGKADVPYAALPGGPLWGRWDSTMSPQLLGLTAGGFW